MNMSSRRLKIHSVSKIIRQIRWDETRPGYADMMAEEIVDFLSKEEQEREEAYKQIINQLETQIVEMA